MEVPQADGRPVETGSGVQSANKEKQRRSRTGCLCCRLRKKKCDERQPTCVACERNYLLCNWPPANPEKERRGVRAGSNASKAKDANSKVKIKPENRQRGLSNAPPDEADTQLITTGSTSMASTRTNHHSSGSSGNIPSPIVFNDIYVASPAQQQLYQNFLKKTANTLSGWQDDANPFINYIIPMAASDDLISQSVLTLSGCHLFYSETDALTDTRLWSSTHETLLIRGLKFGITRYANNQDNSLSLLISTLLLCLKETIIGNSNSNVIIHLKAARTLLLGWLSTPAATFEVGIRTFVVELYLYLAILFYIPLGIDLDPFIFQDSKSLFPYLRGVEHSGALLGCAHELYEIIPRIACLARERDAEVNTMARVADDEYATFAALRREIVLWSPPPNASKDFAHCGLIWQQAVLVFLYTSFMKFSDKPFDLARLVDHAFRIVEVELRHLPYKAPIATTLNWPLAVLGSCLTRPEHQNLVRNHLSGLGDHLKMGCFRQLLQVLEVLWRSPLPKTGMSAFQEVTKEMGIVILMV